MSCQEIPDTGAKRESATAQLLRGQQQYQRYAEKHRQLEEGQQGQSLGLVHEGVSDAEE